MTTNFKTLKQIAEHFYLSQSTIRDKIVKPTKLGNTYIFGENDIQTIKTYLLKRHNLE